MNSLPVIISGVALAFADRYYFPTMPMVKDLGLDKSVAIGVPPLYGLVILSNVVGSSFALVYLGFKVGAARTKYNVKLPHMYAAGDSEDARKFNAVQRGHQQALETYTSYLALSMISGLAFPVTTALFGVLYIVARIKWAEGYAQGGLEDKPILRYQYSIFGPQIWTPILMGTILCVASAVGLLMGKSN